MTVSNQERAWQQIQTHDVRADGQFVYAVRTTGIYCRPSCPSRRPAQNNVALYATPTEARAAGYRACQRCQPDTIHPQASLLARACRHLDQSQEKIPSLSELGRAVGMSPYAMQKLFRQILGITPRQYCATRQAHRFQKELANSASVTEAIYAAGYGSPSRVYESSDSASRATMGMTPGTYRKQGAGQRIRYTTASSSLGEILVAATERGLCRVALGDTQEELWADLQHDFAQANLQRDDQALSTRLSVILAQLQEHPISTVLSLDVRATAFQRRVWDALQQIPIGQTQSYSEIAESIGQPTAVRAVARACSQNPVAIVIPCHRAVGKNGRLTGYRWGMERKQTLLALERKGSQPA